MSASRLKWKLRFNDQNPPVSGSPRMASKGDFEAEKQKLKEFLANFATTDEEGRKTFKYAEQLTAIAHRLARADAVDLAADYNGI